MCAQPSSADTLKAQVRQKYGELAADDSSCCSPSSTDCSDVSESYDDVAGYEADADLNLGCGLPTEIARLQPGETVLDLGSGAGLDAFVARRAVEAEGRVLGVDFAPEMVEKARRNADKLGYDNVAFHLGEIEALPLEDAFVDVAISNCVLNLVPDKAQAFRETFRVLRPGGRFVISDIVSTGTLPEAIQSAAELYAGCVAGALPKTDYLSIISDAGFVDVSIPKQRALSLPDEVLRPHLSEEELSAFRASEKGLLSVTVTGTKPT